MDAWRYGVYLLVFTFGISLENKFHISARPCIILYASYNLPRYFTSPKAHVDSQNFLQVVCGEFI